ncbi:glycosyltransferase family 4 protein [Pedobacter cryotolerans]|uniref:Glycosyltransferase family 4 protein n=1 Tax=Pedobacter cryotolerans TaxID=2571270 RepID=A0A4U1C4Q0_9SPHI|nr:glycosyltransferase family 4 protein [Pedobacter cryotolerans]TKB98241.1 glycosyltransferase family 4 protein [Pedobacter cryotolerans]
MKILFLTLNTFSLTGGIEKVGRAICKVLSDLQQDKKITSFNVLSVYDNKPDINYVSNINFNGFKANKISFAISTLSKSRANNIVILSHINLLVFGWLIKNLTSKKRIILIAHGIEVWHQLKNWKINFLQKHCEIWAVSNFTANQLIRQGISKERIKVLNNGLDPFFSPPKNFEKPTHLLKKYHLNTDQNILFTLTRMSFFEQYKGYDQIIALIPQLLTKYPNLHYILAGKADEMELERIKKLIKKLRIEQQVTLTGFLQDEEVNDHYLLADVFVMPSKGEGFGISFIEAAACGCPSIAGNADGSLDALLNGELGTLIDPSSSTEIAKAINENLSEPKTKALQNKLQQLSVAHFGYDQYKTKVFNLLYS